MREYYSIGSRMNLAGNRPYQPVPRSLIRMTDDLYRELAELARIEAENAETDYTKIIVEAERNGNTYIVEVQALLEFDYDRSPCGRPLAYLRKITPCWVQCETFNRWGDQHPNDFSIEKIKKLL